jgi:hypothetical protein
LASTWVDECLEAHGRCSASVADGQPLPHRVIDVGPPDGLTEPYLLETSGQTASYLTLSHCWGGETPIRTTIENVQRHRTEIKVADMPRTFRDAVIITRKLRCRYLWIDSLCIIQDDRKDWEKEAVLMHQYYKQSLVTIAAADSSDSTAGLFRDRDGQANRPCELEVTCTNGSQKQIYAYTNSMSSELKRSSLSPLYEPIRLYSRAWVFQEQALSPRVLTYAKGRISWRCQEVLFEERPPLMKMVIDFIKECKTSTTMTRRGDPRIIEANVAELQRKWIFPTPGRDISRDNSNIGYHQDGGYSSNAEFLVDWGALVQDYTQRDLTYQSDKLIAIQGVADAVAPLFANTYFGGVWVGSTVSIFMGLLWSLRWGTTGLKRLDVAPTWSWASVSGEVAWPGHWLCRLKPKVEIIELVRPKSAICPTELVAKANVRTAVTENGKDFFILDWQHELLETPATQRKDIATSSRWPLDSKAILSFLDENIDNNAVVWFAELAAGDVQLQGGRKQVHCLILAVTGENATFRRVGYSIWEEHRWVSKELPMPKIMDLRII